MRFPVQHFFRFFGFFHILAFAAIININATGYYVSSRNGDDNNNGTSPNTPWKSLAKLKTRLSSLVPGDVVYFECGSEWDHVNLRLNGLKGTQQSPIIFTTYGTGAKPRLKGTKTITSFSKNNNIWRSVDPQLPDYVTETRRMAPFVYINDKRYEPSRYPNNGYLYTTTTGSNNYLASTDNKWYNNQWKNGMAVVRSVSWIWYSRKISGNTSYQLFFDNMKHNYERSPTPYLIRNHVNACDQNGEWAQQNDTLWIYYSGELNLQKVEVPVIDTMIRINNCTHIRLDGLSIERSVMFSVHVVGSTVDIRNCAISDAGAGLVLSTNCSVLNAVGNSLKYGRRGGIYLENSHGLIKNNLFKHFAFEGADNSEKTFGAALANHYCDNLTYVTENVFDSVNIGYHGHWSNAESFITKNLMTNFGMTIRDCAAIYFGSDFTSSKKNVKRNIIDNAVNDFVHGIYMDYSTRNVIADSNSISNTNLAVYVHVSANNSIKYNNIVVPSKVMINPWNSAIRFDEHIYNLGVKDVSPVIGNELLNNNIVLGTGVNENAVMYFDLHSAGSNRVYNNRYFDPYNEDKSMIISGEDYFNYRTYALEGWQWASGLDAHSTFNQTNWFYNSSMGIPKEDFVFLATNPTNEEIEYNLTGKWADFIDIEGNHHRSSIRIPPYYSVILFYYGKVDVTNEPPSIINQTFEIQQSAFVNNFVGKVKASDADAGQTLKFSIVSGNPDGLFRIDELTGELYSQFSVDFSSNPVYVLSVMVTDNGDPVMSTTANITVKFIANLPAENRLPVIRDQGFNIEQSSFTDNLVGIIVASDPDPGQQLVFSILSGNQDNIFRIDAATGYLYAQLPVNFSQYRAYDLTVQARDNGTPSLSSAANIVVLILPTTIVHYIDPERTNDPIEDGTISHPFNSWADITWKSDHTYLQKAGTTATIDNINIGASSVQLDRYGTGENPNVVFTSDNYGLRILNKTDVLVRNFSFEAPNALYCVNVLGSSTNNIEFSYCRFSNSSNGIRVDGNNIVIAYNDFTIDGNCITSNASNTNFYYNLFKRSGVGISYQLNESENHLYNNLFYGNKVGVELNRAKLISYNNIFYFVEPDEQAISSMAAPVNSDHNLFYPVNPNFINISGKSFNNLSSFQQSMSLEQNSIADDPLFYDALNSDFTVSENSPVLDEGKNIGILADYIGNPVPLGNTTDIGPFESKSSKPELNFAAYPNPSKGHLFIEVYNSNFEGGDFIVTSMTGEMINMQKLPSGNQHVIDLKKLIGNFNGICLVHIAAQGRVSYSQRIIVIGK